ncbi:hypothetical protein O0L34_g19002 [Tuta absoluta]|nr:hypothetical protein O0L34_g19002 [Tuta absoluta]
MLPYILVPLFLAASVQSIYPIRHYSAASPAQIRFAKENKYDDTGPGAKQPEAAYKTYKNLDDALMAYVDDPDTQLPQNEKARAIANLYRQKETPNILPYQRNYYARLDESKFGLPYGDREMNGLKELFRWNREQRQKKTASFSHTPMKPFRYEYIPNPEVEFSIDVHVSIYFL